MIGVVIALLVFGYISWRSREGALIILAASLPIYLVRFFVGPLPLTLLECMIGITFLAWIIRDKRLGATLKEFAQKKRIFLTFAILFLISATISVFVSSDTRAALGLWRAYFIEPALIFLVAYDTVRTKDQMRRMVDAVIVSASIIASVAVYQRFTGWHIPTPWLAEMRVTSVFPYPNAVGLYLAPIVPLIGARFFDSLKNRGHIMRHLSFVGVFFLAFAGIYFAKTEGALVALAVSIPFMGFVWSKRTRIVTVVVCAFIIAVMWLSPNLLEPIKEKVLLRDWSGHVRQKIWKETYAMLQERSVLGTGLAGYQKAIEPYHKAKHIEIFLYPHTLILNFWSEVGLFGLGAFLGLVGALFFILGVVFIHAKKENFFIKIMALGFGGSLATILIHGLVDVPYFKNDLAVFFWLLAAYVFAVARIAQQKTQI